MLSKSAKKIFVAGNRRGCSSNSIITKRNKYIIGFLIAGAAAIELGGMYTFFTGENAVDKEKRIQAEFQANALKQSQSKPTADEEIKEEIKQDIEEAKTESVKLGDERQVEEKEEKKETKNEGDIVEKKVNASSEQEKHVNKENLASEINSDEKEDDEEGEEEKIPKYDLIVVGGGAAGFAVLEELQLREFEGSVLMISDSFLEQRPPLTHELWFEEDPDKLDKMVRDAAFGFRDKFSTEQFQFYAGTVAHLDPLDERLLVKSRDDQSHVVAFDKCILATGSRPKQLDVPKPKENKHITTYQTLRDFVYLHHVVVESPIQNVSIIGGDFLGTELAYALLTKARRNNVSVSLFTKENGVLGKYLPEYFSDYVTNKLRNYGIDIKTNSMVTEISEVNERLAIKYGNDGKQHLTDHIVVSIGSVPNTELAEKIDLEIDPNNGGIVTSAYFQATPNIYVIGDVASYYNVALGRMRTDYDQTAKLSGKYAARNVMGDLSSSYLPPSFKGTLDDDDYYGYGRIDSKLKTVGTWMRGPTQIQCSVEEPDTYIVQHSEDSEYEKKKEFKQGIIYYLDGQRIVGALGWNIDCFYADQVIYKKERKYETDLEVTRAISFEDLLIDDLAQQKPKTTAQSNDS
jgi:programmed cell death 8 (apoptosis-inducing factor)